MNFIKIMLIYEKIKNPEKGMDSEFITGFAEKPTKKTTKTKD